MKKNRLVLLITSIALFYGLQTSSSKLSVKEQAALINQGKIPRPAPSPVSAAKQEEDNPIKKPKAPQKPLSQDSSPAQRPIVAPKPRHLTPQKTIDTERKKLADEEAAARAAEEAKKRADEERIAQEAAVEKTRKKNQEPAEQCLQSIEKAINQLNEEVKNRLDHLDKELIKKTLSPKGHEREIFFLTEERKALLVSYPYLKIENNEDNADEWN